MSLAAKQEFLRWADRRAQSRAYKGRVWWWAMPLSAQEILQEASSLGGTVTQSGARAWGIDLGEGSKFSLAYLSWDDALILIVSASVVPTSWKWHEAQKLLNFEPTTTVQMKPFHGANLLSDFVEFHKAMGMLTPSISPYWRRFSVFGEEGVGPFLVPFTASFAPFGEITYGPIETSEWVRSRALIPDDRVPVDGHYSIEIHPADTLLTQSGIADIPLAPEDRQMEEFTGNLQRMRQEAMGRYPEGYRNGNGAILSKTESTVLAAVGMVGALGGLAVTGAMIVLIGSASYYLIKRAGTR